MSARFSGLLAKLTGEQAAGPPSGQGANLEYSEDPEVAGNRARDEGNWGVAIAHYREALLAQPDALGMAVQLGHVLEEVGRYEEAEVCYDFYLAANPHDPDIYIRMGNLFRKRNILGEAVKLYDIAESLAQSDSLVAAEAKRSKEDCRKQSLLETRRFALSLTDQRRFQEAYVILHRLVEQENCEDLVGILGNMCKEVGRFREAEQNYARYEAYALRCRPEGLIDVAVQRGHLAKVQRRYEEAIGHFMRADALLAKASDLDNSVEGIEHEIRICLGQITKSIEIL